MSSVSSNISNVLNLQDVELANAMAALKNDPTKLSQFINSRKTEIYDTVKKEHSDNFTKVYGDALRSSNTNKNVLYYHVRNKDLDKLQGAILDRAKGEADAAMTDSQNAKRQFEINEWTANNKGDTLFIMQLAFIALTLNVPLLYLNKMGMIPTSTFWMIMGLVWIAIFLTVIVRAQYTTMSRNNRFWNRRRFASMGGPPNTPTCESVQASIASGTRALGEVASNLGDTDFSSITDSAQRYSSNLVNALSGASCPSS